VRRHLKPTHESSLIFILAACSAVSSMATNLVLPALPEIRSHFHASIAAVQSMLSVYMIAFACSILVVGPLSDRWGRRPVLIGGMLIFAFGSLLAVAAPSLPVLVFARVVQALGAATGLVIARAVVGDLYEGAGLTQRLATLAMVAVAATSASPYVGGLVTVMGGWYGPLVLLTGIPLALALVCSRYLPETCDTLHRGLPVSAIWARSRAMLTDSHFLICVLQTGVIFSIFSVIITGTPYLLADVMHRSPTDFGLFYLLITVGYFFGNMKVSRSAHVLNGERTTAVGLWVQLGGSVVALSFALAGLVHPLWLFGPMLPMAFGQGIAMPTTTAKAISLAPGFSGIATSLLVFGQQFMGALSVQGMGWAASDSAVPILIFCTVASIAALLPVLISRPLERPFSRL